MFPKAFLKSFVLRFVRNIFVGFNVVFNLIKTRDLNSLLKIYRTWLYEVNLIHETHESNTGVSVGPCDKNLCKLCLYITHYNWHFCNVDNYHWLWHFDVHDKEVWLHLNNYYSWQVSNLLCNIFVSDKTLNAALLLLF